LTNAVIGQSGHFSGPLPVTQISCIIYPICAAQLRELVRGAARGARLKLHVQAPSNSNTVTAYGAGYIEVNRIRHTGSLIVAPDVPIRPWEASDIEQLRAEHFEPVLELAPELVLVGTGATQRFLPPQTTSALSRAGVGFEVMDTAAACRTFNILMAEGRRVVGAFLPCGPA